MATASLATPMVPMFDAVWLRSCRRRVRQAAEIGVFALQGAAFAGVVWLVLAAPGLVAERGAGAPPLHMASGR